MLQFLAPRVLSITQKRRLLPISVTIALLVPLVMSLAFLTTSASFAHPATTVKEDLSHPLPAHQDLSDLSWVLALLAPKPIPLLQLVVVQALATSVFLDTTVPPKQQLFPSYAQLVTTVKKELINLRVALLATTAQLVRLVNCHAHPAITVLDLQTNT